MRDTNDLAVCVSQSGKSLRCLALLVFDPILQFTGSLEVAEAIPVHQDSLNCIALPTVLRVLVVNLAWVFSWAIHKDSDGMILKLGDRDETKKIRTFAPRQNGRLWNQHWEVVAAGEQKVIAKDICLVFGIAEAVGLTGTAKQLESGAGERAVGQWLECFGTKKLAR